MSFFGHARSLTPECVQRGSDVDCYQLLLGARSWGVCRNSVYRLAVISPQGSSMNSSRKETRQHELGQKVCRRKLSRHHPRLFPTTRFPHLLRRAKRTKHTNLFNHHPNPIHSVHSVAPFPTTFPSQSPFSCLYHGPLPPNRPRNPAPTRLPTRPLPRPISPRPSATIRHSPRHSDDHIQPIDHGR